MKEEYTKPEIVKLDWGASMDCACQCGVLNGSGSGGGGDDDDWGGGIQA